LMAIQIRFNAEAHDLQIQTESHETTRCLRTLAG
jgi:hypothetical protein